MFLVHALVAQEYQEYEDYENELDEIEEVELTDDDIIRPDLARAFEEWLFGEKYVFNVPAGNIYPVWDTIRIHPYKVDSTILKDTTVLILLSGLTEKFVPPVLGKVTSHFGFRRYRYHYGIDIDLKTGDSVLCAFDGMVRIVARSRSYGWVVVVRHYNGLESIYAHLSKTSVYVGEDIKAGQLIGLGGNTGRSRGSHLHLEFRYLGLPINPTEIIDFTDENNFKLLSDTLILKPSTFYYITEKSKFRYHRIRKGDTVTKIARKYGVSVAYLCKINKISPKTKLKPGKLIRYR